MFVIVWRTVSVRVRPNDLLVFAPIADGANGNAPNSGRGFLSKFKTSWNENYSLFSWADKGRWETVQSVDPQAVREGDWFRIGFEPVFVDYTKSGTWFAMFCFVEASEVLVEGRGGGTRRFRG